MSCDCRTMYRLHTKTEFVTCQPRQLDQVKAARSKSDFSIDAILSRSNTNQDPGKEQLDCPAGSVGENGKQEENQSQYSWLYCTRYQPPKLPRVKREAVAHTKYRNPRIPFSMMEVAVLEEKFRQAHYLGSKDVAQLAAALDMPPKRVKIWFQNRRARERREREKKS